jgi:hypothetical protein
MGVTGMKSNYLITLAAVMLSGTGIAVSQTTPAPPAATGTLNVDILDFTSDVKLKPKVEKAIKTGGMEWGVKDGLIVFSMVNKRFINFDMPQFTRYGRRFR